MFDDMSYNAVGDISTIAICFVMGILVWQTNLRENSRIRILLAMLFSTYTATFTDLFCDYSMRLQSPVPLVTYSLRIAHHITLLFTVFLYLIYLEEPLWIPAGKRKKYNFHAFLTIIVCFAADIYGIISKKGFVIKSNGTISEGINFYTFMFVLLFMSVIYLLVKYKSHIIDQVFISIFCVSMVSVILLIIQSLCQDTSFTCLACFFPIVNVIFIFHSNPYDVETGAVSERFFYSEMKDSINKKEDFTIISCKLSNFSNHFRNSKELRTEFNLFFHRNIKRCILYHFPDDRFIIVIKEKKKVNTSKIVDNMVKDFNLSYQKFRIDYMNVIINSSAGLDSPHSYLRLLNFIESDMTVNSTKIVEEKDIEHFHNNDYILSQLEDIIKKGDMNDKRVIVYCQPVFNILTGQYDTAEALMRLELEKTGMVYPDVFIPIAEQNNMIHMLSMIILSKTCSSIRDFIEEGYYIKRISVNFSVLDIKYDSFYDEVKSAIDRNCIPYDKIAVEITESRSEADFNVMKRRVIELQNLGIKFYLDDFGTGYSNFERIMEIPFDIIKFDRSLLIESTKNTDSNFMVNTFAEMFNKLNYAVLFEGVENDSDELHCIGMNAKYLQGYKYSKPIPMEKLRNFLQKNPESA